jgi:hypothetical protein
MVKSVALAKFAPLLHDAAVGAFVWVILTATPIVDVDIISKWVHLGGYVTAVITGVVMCYKNRNNAKEIVSFIIELLKK